MKMFLLAWSKGLSFRLILALISSVSLIYGIILYFNYNESKILLTKVVQDSASHLLESAVNKIEGHLSENKKLAETLAQFVEKEPLPEKKLRGLLQNLIDNNPDVLGTAIAFEPYAYHRQRERVAYYFHRKGDSIVGLDISSEVYNYPLADWYQIPKRLKTAMFSEPYFDFEGSKQVVVTYSIPVYKSVDSSLYAVVTVDLSLRWLNTLMKEMRFYEQGYGFIISENGTFIVHQDDRLVLNESVYSIAEVLGSANMYQTAHKLVAGEEGYSQTTSAIFRKPSFTFYMPIKLSRWALGVVVPENELFAELNTLQRRFAVVGGFGLLLLVCLIIVLSRRITRPLKALAGAASHMGKGHFDVPLPVVSSHDEVRLLSDSLQLMQEELRVYVSELSERITVEERLMGELRVAQDIQESLIPHDYPAFAGVPEIDIFGLVKPAKEVGGDLFDYFQLDGERIVFAIGDVSGKGVPAALFMAIMRTLLRTHALRLPQRVRPLDLSLMMREINAELARDNTKMMFVTCFVGVYHLKTGHILYCNAGHNSPHVKHAGGDIEELPTTYGVALGVFPQADFSTAQWTLASKEMLILCTDGVTEAIASNGQFLGESRWQKTLEELPDDDAQNTCQRLLDGVEMFYENAEQADDITLLILKNSADQWSEQPMQTLEFSLQSDVSEIERLPERIAQWEALFPAISSFSSSLNLVLEEAVSNIILYSDGKDIEVVMEGYTHQMKMYVCDGGCPFNPLAHADVDITLPLEQREIGGLGIHLIKNLMDEVDYRYEGGKNVLILTKRV